MKSFKDKANKKQQEHLEEQKKIQEEQLRLDKIDRDRKAEQARQEETRKNKEYLAEQARQDAIEYQRHIEQRHQHEEAEKEIEKLRFERKIDDYRTNRNKINEFKNKQKDEIKNILNSEKDVRHTIRSIESLKEIEEYETNQLQQIQSAEDVLYEYEQKQLAKKQQQEQEQLAKQEKQEKYKLQEQAEEAEQQKLDELRQEQAKEAEQQAQERLDKVLAEREEFETQQKIIAENSLQQRQATNKILSDAQNILNSDKESNHKSRLSGLRDYIYKLNPTQEHDPWVDRKQPISILTWEDWKKIPTNENLIEMDFRRAKMLFEQDNMRAQLYHDHMWHWSQTIIPAPPGKGVDRQDIVTDVPYLELVAKWQAQVENIGGISSWMDASDVKYIHTIASESISLTKDNLKIFFSGNEDQDETNLTIADGDKNNLFDGNRDTFLRITNASSSYEWPHTGSVNGDPLADSPGNQSSDILTLQIEFPDGQEEKISKIEIRAVSRSAMPVAWEVDGRISGSVQGQYGRRFDIISIGETFNLDNKAQNNQFTITGESFHHPESASGGFFGIDGNGSASIDSYYLDMPRNEELWRGIQFNFKVFTTGSHVDINDIIIYKEGVTSSVQHGDNVGRWVDKANTANHFSRPNYAYTRQNVQGYPVWYSGSNNSFGNPKSPLPGEAEAKGTLDMPFINFHSASMTLLTQKSGSYMPHQESSEQTHFLVLRERTGRQNYASTMYSEYGSSHRERYEVQFTNFYTGLRTFVWDNDTGNNSGGEIMEFEFQGKAQARPVYGFATESAWPYLGDDHGDSGLSSLDLVSRMFQRKARIMTTQIEKPDPDTGAQFNLWIDGGPAMINTFHSADETFVVNDYITTGSAGLATFGGTAVAPPGNLVVGQQYGAASQFGAMDLHESIFFDRKLSIEEIRTVQNYLSAKWQIPIDEALAPNSSSLNMSGSTRLTEQENIDPARPFGQFGTLED